MKRLCLIIGLFVFMSCVPESVVDPRPYETPDMVTALGINVWTKEDINLDEIDEYFLEIVDKLNYGSVLPVDLIISPTHCREYPDGFTYCGFEDPDMGFMLAGRFYYLEQKPAIKIHLMKGEGIDPEDEWTLGETAFAHEVEHYVMYIHNIPGWNINNKTLALKEMN